MWAARICLNYLVLQQWGRKDFGSCRLFSPTKWTCHPKDRLIECNSCANIVIQVRQLEMNVLARAKRVLRDKPSSVSSQVVTSSARGAGPCKSFRPMASSPRTRAPSCPNWAPRVSQSPPVRPSWTCAGRSGHVRPTWFARDATRSARMRCVPVQL